MSYVESITRPGACQTAGVKKTEKGGRRQPLSGSAACARPQAWRSRVPGGRAAGVGFRRAPGHIPAAGMQSPEPVQETVGVERLQDQE